MVLEPIPKFDFFSIWFNFSFIALTQFSSLHASLIELGLIHDSSAISVWYINFLLVCTPASLSPMIWSSGWFFWIILEGVLVSLLGDSSFSSRVSISSSFMSSFSSTSIFVSTGSSSSSLSSLSILSWCLNFFVFKSSTLTSTLSIILCNLRL